VSPAKSILLPITFAGDLLKNEHHLAACTIVLLIVQDLLKMRTVNHRLSDAQPISVH